MTYIPRSSFLPAESPGVIPETVKKRRTIRIFSLLSTTILIGSVVLAVALFGYNRYLHTQLELKQTELSDTVARSTVTADMASLKEFDARLQKAEKLLQNHLSPSRLLTQVERMTKQTVQIENFSYTYEPNFEAVLELRGQTAELMSVAVQKEQYGKERLFSVYDLNEVTLGTNERDTDEQSSEEQQVLPVAFSMKGVLNVDEIRYTGDFVALRSLEIGNTFVAESPTAASLSTESVYESSEIDI